MRGALMKAKIVRVKVERGSAGLYYATSPDVRGLLVAKSTVEELEEAIPEALTALYLALGIRVVVSEAEDSDDGEYSPWVAISAEVAKAALSRECQ